jgi:hypothetical protein
VGLMIVGWARRRVTIIGSTPPPPRADVSAVEPDAISHATTALNNSSDKMLLCVRHFAIVQAFWFLCAAGALCCGYGLGPQLCTCGRIVGVKLWHYWRNKLLNPDFRVFFVLLNESLRETDGKEFL